MDIGLVVPLSDSLLEGVRTESEVSRVRGQPQTTMAPVRWESTCGGSQRCSSSLGPPHLPRLSVLRLDIEVVDPAWNERASLVSKLSNGKFKSVIEATTRAEDRAGELNPGSGGL